MRPTLVNYVIVGFVLAAVLFFLATRLIQPRRRVDGRLLQLVRQNISRVLHHYPPPPNLRPKRTPMLVSPSLKTPISWKKMIPSPLLREFAPQFEKKCPFFFAKMDISMDVRFGREWGGVGGGKDGSGEAVSLSVGRYAPWFVTR